MFRLSPSRGAFAALLLGLPLPVRALGAQRAVVDSMTSAPVTNLRYEVGADRGALASRHLRVTTTFDVAGASPVVLSLPMWAPGAYEISNFPRWVSSFSATQNGVPLRWDKLDYEAWRVQPTRAGTVTVSFLYQADTLDNAMCWTRPDFALFNGTNLFLYPKGRSLDFPATMVVRAESDHRVVTSMSGGGPARTYRAASYHELVDMPVFVGRFDVDSETILGKVVRYATYPAGSVSGGARATAWDQIRRVIPVEVNVFGEVPWGSYTIMQIADSSYQGASGLEHADAQVDVLTPLALGSAFQPSLYAHELFHAWNVKRLRPADMVPYRYDAPQPTPWLWVSEGITDYYADLAEVRSGVIDARGFYALTAGKMGEIESLPPFELEDASVNTWVHPTDGTGYAYYPKGSLAGLLLDITIRDASDNRSSLDAVMRELYRSTYKAGRGFGFADFWGAVRRAANGRSFDDFNRRYIDGRDPYPWPDALHTIGLRIERDSAPRLGLNATPETVNGVRVTTVAPGGAAAAAGVLPNDLLLKLGDVDVRDADFGAKFRQAYMGKASGAPVPIVVERNGERLTLPGVLVYAPGAPRISEDPRASARAVRLRNGILRGVTDR